MLPTLVIAQLMLGGVAPEDPGAAPLSAIDTTRWSWVALPMFSLNVDEGAGGGLVAAVYRFENEKLRDDISFRGSLTSRWIQRYELRWQGHEVAGLPLRISARAGFFSTMTRTYCGEGNGVTCDVEVAEAAALDAGLRPGTEPYDEFVRRFYFVQFMRPFVDGVVRWRIFDRAAERDPIVEVFAGPRFAWMIPGELRTILQEQEPIRGSLYARAHPDGEPGPTAIVQAGLTVDARDFEWSPSRGYFLETSLRGSVVSPNGRQHVGGNLALSGYVPLNDAARAPLESDARTALFAFPVTLAQRAMVDVVWGDIPTEELAITGGVYGHPAFGGQWIGRGMRDYRYLGKIRVVEQAELRTELFHFTVWKRHVDIGAGLFGDAAWIGADWDDVDGRIPGVNETPGSPWRILFGGGVGIRALIDRAILLRIDVAASPFERGVAFYTPVGYPF